MIIEDEISAADTDLRCTVMCMLEVAIVHSVLYKTGVEPTSSIFKEVIHDADTKCVIRALYMT